MVKEALVIERNILFKERYFQDFLAADQYNFIPIILDNLTYHPRGDELEDNPGLQQIIPYVWIVNISQKKVFVYKRASGKNYNEKRLMNKISCGVGGHIDKEDSENPIEKAMMRELREEVKMKNYPKPRIIGYLNDDSNSVGKVHFGIVAIAETREDVKKGDSEMVEGRFYSLQEFEKMLSDPHYEIESWTKLSWPHVKKYIS